MATFNELITQINSHIDDLSRAVLNCHFMAV